MTCGLWSQRAHAPCSLLTAQGAAREWSARKEGEDALGLGGVGSAEGGGCTHERDLEEGEWRIALLENQCGLRVIGLQMLAVTAPAFSRCGVDELLTRDYL